MVTTKNSHYRDLLGRVVCLRPSRDLTVCAVGEPVSRAAVPQDKACREGRRGWMGPGLPCTAWQLASCFPVCLPPGLGQAQLVSAAALMPWPGASRKKDVCECVGGAGCWKPSPLSLAFPGPSRRRSTQISLHGKPPNLAFDSVSGGRRQVWRAAEPSHWWSSGQTVSTRPGRPLRTGAVRSQEGRGGALLPACLPTRNQKPSRARPAVPNEGAAPSCPR